MFWFRKKKIKLNPRPPQLTEPERYEAYMDRVRQLANERESILDIMDRQIIEEYRNSKKEKK